VLGGLVRHMPGTGTGCRVYRCHNGIARREVIPDERACTGICR
jgi:hypothetical protein